MGLKNDRWIIEKAIYGHMIDPFEREQVHSANGHGVVSYGVSSYGYDMRVANEFKIFTNHYPGCIDPKNFDAEFISHNVVAIDGFVYIPPNSFALARSVEYFRIPREVLTICIGKSTYARCGVIINLTAFEPEWCGHVTIEISNTTPLPAKIYANEGIAQVLFFEADHVCDISYKDKGGRYQGQMGIQSPIV